jgi:hypothetical protein
MDQVLDFKSALTVVETPSSSVKGIPVDLSLKGFEFLHAEIGWQNVLLKKDLIVNFECSSAWEP